MTQEKVFKQGRRFLVAVSTVVGIILLSLDDTFSWPAFSILLSIAGVALISEKFGGLTSTIFDGILITLLLVLTGGAASPLSFLYLVAIGVIAVNNSRDNALIGSFLFISMYVVLGFSTYSISRLDFLPIELSIPTSGLLLQSVGLFSGMVLIAVFGAYLSAALDRKTQEVQSVSEQARAFLDKLPDPILTTDLKGNIVSWNAQAEEIFGITKAKNSSIASLFGKQASLESLIEDPTLIHEESKKTYQVLHRTLTDSSGEKEGHTFIFQDITALDAAQRTLSRQSAVARLLTREGDVKVSPENFPEFIGESPMMKKVFQLIRKVSPTDSTVLVTGESGTGKELVARAIHQNSQRAKHPFVPVNCGAIPEQLLESEFFGHKKGSFTGAVADKPGYFEQADGGTIFLDEIGELPLSMQAKLLRAIQERSIHPVGGSKDISVNVRIITATNKNLKNEVAQGKFREDLFYRLNVINIPLPPLRERKEDLPLLLTGILKKLCKDRALPIIPPETVDLFQNYSYPGNVRELENILERAIVMGGEAILPEHLPELTQGEKNLPPTTIHVDDDLILPMNLDSALSALEKKYLEAALSKTGGAKQKAAELLQMNFRSFRYRLQKYGMSSHD